MNVDAWSSSTLKRAEGYRRSIPVHFAWSRGLYQSAAVAQLRARGEQVAQAD